MKRRLLTLILIVSMLLGMNMTSLAAVSDWEDGTFSGNYELMYYYRDGMPNHNTQDAITVAYENEKIEGSFVTDHGDIISFVASDPEEYTGGYRIAFKSVIVQVNGESFDVGGSLVIDQFTNQRGIKFSCSFGNEDYTINMDMVLDEVDSPSEPELHEISTPFTGVAESDRGDYTLAIAGYYIAELTDGDHVLSASDITSQTIAIVAYNKANGVKRVMNQSTAEEMTVTISGGKLVSATIRGRVQTDGGSLDRYTANINN